MKIIHGDCLEVLKTLDDNSIDSVVTDPPYGLSFMGKKWDYDVPKVEIWKEALRVLKPGGYLLSFASTRTYHRMAVNIEDAGFEIRDMIFWTYASGFPKSLNIFKQLSKRCTCGNMEAYERATQKSQSQVRPVRKADIPQTFNPQEKQGEVLQSGLPKQDLPIQQSKSSKNVRSRQPSVEGRSDIQEGKGKLQGSDLSEVSEEVSTNGKERRIHNATQAGNGSTPKQAIDENRGGTPQRPQSQEQQDREPCAFCKQYGTQAMGAFGYGSALKPACEPITVARKPLSEKNLADNFLKWGTGGINIDECRVGSETHTIKGGGGGEGTGWGKKEEINEERQGRFPANFIHDGSDEVVGLFPNESARFFYCAKASKSERNKGCEGLEEKEMGRNQSSLDGGKMLTGSGNERSNVKLNNHPTVKPIALMEYLIKLVSREGATILDPFAGSGTTGLACQNLGRKYILIEKELEYVKIIKARLRQKALLDYSFKS